MVNTRISTTQAVTPLLSNRRIKNLLRSVLVGGTLALGAATAANANWYNFDLRAPERLHDKGQPFTVYHTLFVETAFFGPRQVDPDADGSQLRLSKEELKKGVLLGTRSEMVRAILRAALEEAGAVVVDDPAKATYAIMEREKVNYATQWPATPPTIVAIDQRFDKGKPDEHRLSPVGVGGHLLNIGMGILTRDMSQTVVGAALAASDLSGLDQKITDLSGKHKKEKFMLINECYDKSTREAKSCNQGNRDLSFQNKVRIQAVLIDLMVMPTEAPGTTPAWTSQQRISTVARRVDQSDYAGNDLMELLALAAHTFVYQIQEKGQAQHAMPETLPAPRPIEKTPATSAQGQAPALFPTSTSTPATSPSRSSSTPQSEFPTPEPTTKPKPFIRHTQDPFEGDRSD